MAEHLASIYGTEKDKVNCPFYFKIGACRHGERCSRQHNKPPLSQTIMLRRLYDNPAISGDPNIHPDDYQQQFDDFYEDIFEELSKYGEIEEMNICDNACEHLLGNVYVKFFEEEDAKKALEGLFGRFYAGKPILPEYSPVTDFREASCRQHALSECDRGGFCNFIHLKRPTTRLQKRLFGHVKRHHEEDRDQDRRRGGGGGDRRDRDRRRRSRSRSRSRDRDRRRDRSRRDRSRERGGRDKHRSKSRSRSRDRDRRRDRSRERDRSGEGDNKRERERDRDSEPPASINNDNSNNNNNSNNSAFNGEYQ